WNTIDTCLPRTCRRAEESAFEMSVPRTSTVPAVGAHSPLSVRIRVDLPEPDRPMTTKISPSSTSKLASMTAAIPILVRSFRSAPSSSRLITSFGRLPRTLYTFDALTTSLMCFLLAFLALRKNERLHLRLHGSVNVDLIGSIAHSLHRTLISHPSFYVCSVT